VKIIVVDTDVASRLQRGTVPLDYLSALRMGTAAITFVTVAEMFKGAFKAAWGPSRIGQLESWLAVWPVLPYDATVPRVWGRLVADREAVGSPVAANDAWIAACYIAAGVPLMTLNRKHFEAIRGLTLLP
jgi:predicted nucleic acid-binding protein